MSIPIGSGQWFRNKAITSVTKIQEGVWDYSDSSVLYTPAVSSAYEEAQKDAENTSYKKSVTDEEALFIEKIAPKVIQKLPNTFTYIDLGPGTEHKEKFFQDAVIEQRKDILYVPIDISEQMLKIADDYAKTKGFATHPLHQTFEDLQQELAMLPKNHRFVSLGLTFTNYQPEIILGLLKQISGSDGSLFITVQVRERVNIPQIQKVYKEVIAEKMMPGKLSLVGLDFHNDISDIEVTEDVEIYATLKNVSQDLARLGVQVGDRMLLLRSYRYSLDQLRKTLEQYEVEYFDENMQFVGCLIKGRL